MDTLTGWVVEHGWGVVALLAVLETCFVTGLVVPSGMTAAFAAGIAAGDRTAVVGVWLAAAAGGFLGDLIGYVIGRRGGERLLDGSGWTGSTLRRHQKTAGRYLGRHAIFSVTFARLVSFVRTLMPLSAGINRMPAPIYLIHEIPGVLLWATLYVGIGVLAGESWQVVSGMVGAGWLALFGIAGVILWWRARRSGSIEEVVE